MTDGFLNKVYSARSAEETRDLYDAWAASYDAEIRENGYATPGRCAAALAQFSDNLDGPILDFGCGTGLSGVALRLAGFTHIDGVDLSADMLRGAQDKNVYKALRQIAPEESPVDAPGQYQSIAAIGVIGAGAAPLDTFDLLMNSLPTRGKLVFSFNDHVLSDPAYEGRVNSWTGDGRAHLLFQEHGDHLPGIGVKSTVYVIEKA